MKIRSGYILQQVMDVYVVMCVGDEAYNRNQIMTVNETGAFLWNLLENGADRKELAEALVREYEVDARTAEEDADEFISRLREKSLIEE